MKGKWALWRLCQADVLVVLLTAQTGRAASRRHIGAGLSQRLRTAAGGWR